MKKLIFKILLYLFLFNIQSGIFAQAPNILWQKCLGGTSYDEAFGGEFNLERSNNLIETNDGGIVMIGNSTSNDGDLTENKGFWDAWIVKMDKNGNIEWQKNLGGSNWDHIHALCQTNDNGLIVVGQTSSNDGDISNNHGEADGWIVKLNSNGSIVWKKCFGGSREDKFSTITKTSDGGFILGGTTNSNDGTVSDSQVNPASAYRSASWVLKIDNGGLFLWQIYWQGTYLRDMNAIIETKDKGFAITGINILDQFTVRKFNSIGIKEWEANELFLGLGNNLIETADNSIIAVGTSYRNSLGGYQRNAVKLSSAGTVIWKKFYPYYQNSVREAATSVIETCNGDLMILGYRSLDSFSQDIILLNTDSQGVPKWEKLYGGNGQDYSTNIIETQDKGYIIGGVTNSQNGDVQGNHGAYDLWIAKLEGMTTEHFHQITNNSVFTNRKLLKTNETTYFICADGSESSIFKFTGSCYDFTNLEVELLGNPDNNRTDGHFYGQITVLSKTADSLVIRYKHPDHFNGSTESIVGGFFLKNSITGSVIRQYALNIYRPPVLIATGWFTDKASATTFENELFSSSLYSFNASSFVHRVVYENATYLPINTNKQAIPNTINAAILALRNKNIAAGKVDLIAHSDGGLLGRLYLQDDNYRQDIHKLITINTPHGGSHKANFWSSPLLQDLYCNSSLDPKKCDKGLINDLRVNSEFINYTLNGPKKNNHITPSHAIATTVFETELALTEPPSYIEWQNCTTTIAVASLVGPAGSIAGLYLCAGGFLASRLKDAVPNIILDLSNSAIFKSPFNDQIVSLSSQLGGLQEYSTTQISNQVHETSLANQNVFQRVLELIKSDINSNDFCITGFNPPFLSYLAPINSKINSLPSSKFKINRPIMSSRYYKGRLLDIDIIGSDIAEMKIIVGYKSDSVYIINSTSANTNFKFPLDTILGERKMIVIAKTNDGNYIQDSTSFWITDNICEQTDLNSYMYLTGSPSSGTFSFNKIASNAKIEAIEDVTFKSTGFTLLMPGFESKNKSIFKVEAQLACPPIGAILWDKKWGTGNSQGYSIDVSNDYRNYFVGSDFFNGCTTPNKNGQIQKLDVNGNQVWTYCMSRLAGGGSQAIKSTSDGGCIFTEITSSCGLITKLNNSGSISWQKCIPNSNYFSVNATNDGSYIIGYKNYLNSVSPSSSIVKIDNLGNIIWQKNFSDTTLIPIAPIIIPTQDGGYYVAKSVNTRRDETGFDLDIIKLDATGTLVWQKEFDWGINDFVREVRETNDQGVILVGGIEPDLVSINGYEGNSDAFLLKLSKTGNTEWLKCFGWAGTDEGKTITIQNDGYLLGGYSNDGIPNELNCSYNSINSGSWIMKIDNSGNKVWQKCIQAVGNSEIINSMKITNDSGLILTGSTNKNGGGVWVKKLSISN